MKRFLVIPVFLAALGACTVFAQVTDTQETQLKVTKHAKEAAEKGSADNFTGDVTVESRFASEERNSYRGGMVHFAAGARTAWHSHSLGQTLIVTSGQGRVQSKGGEIREILPGDVVWIPADVEHWHGAAPDSPMSHLAIVDSDAGGATTWMEQVTDTEYLGRH